MHTGAVVACDWLWHECCRLAVGLGHVVDNVLVLLLFVRLVGQGAKDHAQLVLAGRHFVVVLVDLHAHALHSGQHLGAHFLCVVDWVHREVAAFDARTVASVAHLVFGICVPCTVECIDFKGHFVHRNLKTHVVEDEEFSFWAEIRCVTDAGGLEVFFGFYGCATWVTAVGFHCVGFDDVTVDADRFLRIERIDVGCFGLWHQFHVGLINRFPTGDG